MVYHFIGAESVYVHGLLFSKSLCVGRLEGRGGEGLREVVTEAIDSYIV